MTLLAGENITKQFQDRELFKGLSFSVVAGDRIGLVGPNGIGKTTLFDIMAGKMLLEIGQVTGSRECKIAYVEQEISESLTIPLFDFVSSARGDLLDLKKEIDAVSQELAENPESAKVVEKLGDLQHRFELAGGYDFEAELKLILVGLGFPENRFNNPIASFSGGERNRASLARILAAQSTLLLLDEPTNHLDIESTEWLEEYLSGLNKAYIVVSHDRAFLNNTVKKVWEISGGHIDQYFNGFEAYLKEREERRKLTLHYYRHQQEEIKRIEDFIRRNMAGQKTKQAQSKQKFLAKIKRIELPEADRIGPTFKVESSQRSHNLVLQIEEAAFGHGHQPYVMDVSCNLYRGDRVGLIGPNGSGKSTILKTLIGELDLLDGNIQLGSKVDVAYFDQELSDLNDNNIVLDELWQVDTLAEPGRLRSFLARFGFRGEDVFKKVAVLSGGEKTKLALSKLLFLPANFLIFDEPTNHLDIDSRLALEEALLNYSGTFLMVSHDRYFLNRVASKILAIERGGVQVYDGNYAFYREKREQRQAYYQQNAKSNNDDRKAEYAEFKKISQLKGKLRKDLRSTESKIKEHEKRIGQLERDLSYNIPKSDWEKLTEAAKEKERLEHTLLELYDRYEELERLNAEHNQS